MYSWPQRKSLRLKDYDYNQDWYYFVTICTKNREHFFWNIFDDKMVLNDYGKIIHKCLKDISIHFPYTEIDEYIVMPNHVHAIIIIHGVGNADLRSLQDRTKMWLSKIIHGIKSSCTREIRKDYGNYEFAWQKSFYDMIIRNENQLLKAQQYICDNPKNWDTDTNNKE